MSERVNRETMPAPTSAGHEEANERGRRIIKGLPDDPSPKKTTTKKAAPAVKEE